jgi:hypothetical protein
MLPYTQRQEAIKTAAATFPATFGLRAFPDGLFRISLDASYYSDDGVMLYTEVQRDGAWLAFAKGTPEELRREVVEAK